MEICPHCKKNNEAYCFNRYKGVFWCIFCGEPSITDSKTKKIRKMTAKENDNYFKNDASKDKNYLPSADKEKITFEVSVVENAIGIDDYDFYEVERYLKLLFHKTGYFPQVGDNIFGNKKGEDGHNERFFIVGKGIAVDDYNEFKLYVISEKRWYEKNNW